MTVYILMTDMNEINKLQEKITPIMKSYSNIFYLPKYDDEYHPPITPKTVMRKSDPFNPDDIEVVIRKSIEECKIEDGKIIVGLHKIAKCYEVNDTVSRTELFEDVYSVNFTPKSDDKFDIALYFHVTPAE
jgi:hypothetical protein